MPTIPPLEGILSSEEFIAVYQAIDSQENLNPSSEIETEHNYANNSRESCTSDEEDLESILSIDSYHSLFDDLPDLTVSPV